MREEKKGALRTIAVVAAMVLAFLIYAMMAWQDAGLPPAEEVIGDTLAQDRADGAEPTRAIDWDALPPEVVAWVEVPGTRIDEPIVQASESDPNAYLRVDALGRGAYGTPYIDCECSIDSRVVMVYGHHMSDGGVFADFAHFIDGGYANEHDKIILYKRSGKVLELHPAAIDVVNASCESLVIDQEADFKDLVDEADLVLINPAEGDQFFAFATCSYQTSNSRTVVFACGGDNRTSVLD